MQRHFRTPALRLRPFYRVVNHSLNLRVMVNRIKLVARTEIKNPPASTCPTIPSAENLAALKPGDEDLFVGCGNSERLAIHLGLGQFDVIADSFCDRVARIDVPHALAFARFAVAECAACSHQTL